MAVNPPKSFVGSLPPFTVVEKRAPRQRAIDMLLPIKKSYELLAKYGCFAREICDKCESCSVRFASRETANRKCTALANVGVMLKGLRPTGGDGKSQRLSVRFSSLEGLLVNRGEFTLISPVGLVKPFLTLMRGKFWRPFLARKGDGCVKDTRNHPRQR